MTICSASEIAALHEVTVILVTYNSAHCIPMLMQCLRSVPNIYIVDNGSKDDTVQVIKRHLPHAVLLAQKRNLGFGAANNIALAQVRTQYALLLNPDCIISVSQVEQLVQAAHEWPQAAMFAPQLLDRQERVDVNYRWPHRFWHPKCNELASAPCSTGFVTGAVMLFRMSVMKGVGFFDEHFFLYYEDDDLCMRVFQAKQGILVLPQVQVLHASRGSVRGADVKSAEYWRGFHHAQSKIKFARKYEGEATANILRKRVLIAAWLSLPLRLLWPSPKHIGRLWGRISGLREMS